MTSLALSLPLIVLFKSITFRLLKLDRGWWVHASVPDMLGVGLGNLAGSSAGAIAVLLLLPAGFPRSVLVLDFLLCAHLTGGARFLARILRDLAYQHRATDAEKCAVIYGAGAAGVMLLREIRQNPRLNYNIAGFLDDDPRKAGMRVQMVPVLGSGINLKRIANRQRIDLVLIAIPSASGVEMIRMMQCCHDAGIHCKTIPGVSELLAGPSLANQIRNVAVEDLLGRKPVRLDDGAIRAKLSGKVVMVTGAAGSIGSELCRQIARFGPRLIVAFDAGESPLFDIQQEMLKQFPTLDFRAFIGSIVDQRRLAEAFAQYHPQVLYHAAAYKHVPMMESALFTAVENNLLGTSNVAAAAIEHCVEDFVMISSDKAVRPTNVMGLTKRAAELYIGSLRGHQTKFVSVRFGNVLGSNGSVIPIFKKQIAAGGPVTVTHPEMRRFFMTIPEASQLVLQASTMSHGGEIFVLDMGEPVRIVDLAKNLILLSGLEPHRQIKIEYTGVRPGEKLYEELNTAGEEALPTYHEKIKIFSASDSPDSEIAESLRRVRRHCVARDGERLLMELMELVPEYKPSTHLLRQLRLAAEEKVHSLQPVAK